MAAGLWSSHLPQQAKKQLLRTCHVLALGEALDKGVLFVASVCVSMDIHQRSRTAQGLCVRRNES